MHKEHTSMPCDPNNAVFRFLSSWFDRVAEDEDLPLRISVSKENIRAVTRMQLDAAADTARAREWAMLDAWLAREPHGRWRQ
jgi:ribonuclease D